MYEIYAKNANERNSISNQKIIMHDIYKQEFAFIEINQYRKIIMHYIYGEKFTLNETNCYVHSQLPAIVKKCKK